MNISERWFNTWSRACATHNCTHGRWLVWLFLDLGCWNLPRNMDIFRFRVKIQNHLLWYHILECSVSFFRLIKMCEKHMELFFHEMYTWQLKRTELYSLLCLSILCNYCLAVFRTPTSAKTIQHCHRPWCFVQFKSRHFLYIRSIHPSKPTILNPSHHS